MKKNLLFIFLTGSLLLGSCAQSTTSAWQNDDQYENKLNNKQLEKNIRRYSRELELSHRQVKQLERIDKRFTKKEKKLASRGGKRSEIREIQESKRAAMLDVLSTDQQQKLEKLTGKRKLFRFQRERS